MKNVCVCVCVSVSPIPKTGSSINERQFGILKKVSALESDTSEFKSQLCHVLSGFRLLKLLEAQPPFSLKWG